MAFSGYQDFNPDFSNALQQMIAARPGISIGSGYRSPERQAELFRNAVAKYGSEEEARHWVAPPGKSRHNMGIAADLAFATPEDRAWAHENAAQYGLNFRMGHEPWHIELIGGKPTAIGNNTGTAISNPDQQQQTAPPEQLPYDPNYKIAPPPGTPIGAFQVADINALSNLVRSGRSQRTEQLLQNIRGF